MKNEYTVKLLSIISEGAAKNKRLMQENDSYSKRYLYGQCTGTRESERHLRENNACRSNG
jgi:hypothetical protein